MLVARDGTRTPINDNPSFLREPQQPATGVIIVFRDITTEHEAQQALEQWSGRLQWAMHEMFYRTKNNLQSATALMEMSRNDNAGVLRFAVEILACVNHILSDISSGGDTARTASLWATLHSFHSLLCGIP